MVPRTLFDYAIDFAEVAWTGGLLLYVQMKDGHSNTALLQLEGLKTAMAWSSPEITSLNLYRASPRKVTSLIIYSVAMQ